MAPKKVKAQSNVRNSKLWGLVSKSKQDFVKEYRKFDVREKTSIYFKIFQEIELSISQGKLDLCKRFNNLIKYIGELENEEFLTEMFTNPNNPFKSTNMVILACKYNQVFILDYILEIQKPSDKTSPQDIDESSHNAFYYAIRSNNVKLIGKLIDRWPGNYFAENSQALEDLLSQAYDELKLKNVALSEHMEFFVESKLINLRFFSEPRKKQKSVQLDISTIKERIDLVIENILLLREEYFGSDRTDEKFFFMAKFIAQNIHVLKRQLRATYDRLPWEEVEFCLVCYIHSHTKQQEINLFTRATLSRDKILSHLEYFALRLEQEKNVILEGDKGTNIEWLTDLPCQKRENVITDITAAWPQFQELYSDYHSLRDIHTLQKINDYIRLALSANPNDKEGQLVITRVLQVIGEYLKNTLESPKLSTITSEHLLLSLPKSTRNVIVDLRNSLSHSYALSKRTEIQECSDAGFFIGIQNDTKKIGDVISSTLYANKIKTIRMILNKVVESNTLNELSEVSEIFGNAKLELLVPVNFVSSDHEKLKKLISELKKCITGKTMYQKKIFGEIDEIIEKCSGVQSELANVQSFVKGFVSLQLITNLLQNHHIDSNTIKFIKLSSKRTLKDLAPQLKPSNLKEIAELTMKIFNSVRSKGEIAIIDDVSRLTWDIFHLAEMGTDDIKLIQELRDMLTKNRPPIGFKTRRVTYKMREENYNSLLNQKFSELKNVIKDNGLSGDTMKFPSYKNNKKLQAAVEMLMLDIMSILGTSRKCLENNLLFLDDSTPLLTGKSLRNHLAHDNNLVHILLPDPAVAIFLNAKKLSSENMVDINKKIGKLYKNEPSKLKERFYSSMTTIVNQEKLFNALEQGRLGDLHNLISNGADLNARSVDLGWSSLHFASKGPSTECVKFVLDQNIDYNGKDINGESPLHIAATNGRTEIVRLFLEDYNVDPNEKNNNAQTALHLAARNGHNDVIEILLSHKANGRILDKTGLAALNYAISNKNISTAKIIWSKDSSDESMGGFSALHQAADVGSSEMVRFLLENGADVNSKNDNNYTPLHAAAYNGHQEVVEILLSKGANVNAKLINGCTSLHYAVECGYEEITNMLIDSGADVNAVDKTYLNSPLHYASKDGHEGIIRTLLSNKADFNALNSQNITPLHFSVRSGNYNCTILLLTVGADIHARDNSGSTPLDIAVTSGHSNIVDLLFNVRKRACLSPNLKDQVTQKFQLDKLLISAALFGHEEIAEMLIKKGAQVKSNNTSVHGTPLHFAAFNGNNNLIDLLIKNGAIVEARNIVNHTPLHFAALKGNVEAVEMLLNNGADVNADAYQDKPIHLAVQSCNKDVVFLLIKSGANVNAVDEEGNTPLSLAVETRQIEMVRFLIEGGANVNSKSNSKSPLFSAVRNNDIDMVKLLVQNGAIVGSKSTEIFLSTETKDPLVFSLCAGNKEISEYLLKTNVSVLMKFDNHATLLHVATQQGDIDIINTLISKGASIDAKTLDGITPLCIAVQNGYKDVVKMLVTLGAHINFVNDNGTPLHLAASEGHDDIVEILLINGASTNIQDSRNKTPLELAIFNGHFETAKKMLQYENIALNHKYSDDRTLLHLAANMKIVNFLVDQGSDINAEDVYGSKAIHIAAKKGFKDALKFYISKGMSINERDRTNQTLLHYASLKGRTKILEYLIENGADVNALDDNGVSPMHIAATQESTKCVEVLMKNDADYIAVDNMKRKPLDMAQSKQVFKLLNSTENLFQAVKNNNPLDVEKHIRAGAVIDAKRADSGTVLHYAAWKGYDEVVRVLLENDANPNAIICKNKITPLHYATKFCHPNVVMSLLSNGAIYNSLSENCKTPSDLTEDSKILSLFGLINDCFKNVKDGHIRVVNNLNKIESKDIVKAVMGACNEDRESLIVCAIKSEFPKVDMLKEIFQGDIAIQIMEGTISVQEGEFSRALTIFKNMFERRKSILGPNNPGTLDIEEQIARTLYTMGSLKEAMNIIEKVHQKQKDVFGLNSKEALRTKHILALILHRLQRNTEALVIFQEVYEKQTAILGENDTETINTQFDMALVLDGLKKYDEALAHNRTVYDKRKRFSGENSPLTIMALNNIAMVLSNQGKYEEALKIYKDVLEKKNRILGRNHISTLKTLNNIPGILYQQDKFDEALKKYQEVWEVQKIALGPHHPETLKTKHCIGLVFYEKGKWVSALKAFREVYDLAKALYGPHYSLVLSIEEKLERIKFALSCQDTDIWEIIQHMQKDINIAAQKGDIDTVQSILNKGADINDKDMDGRTILHFAVTSKKLDLVHLLLRNGADVTQRTNKGNTTLHTAATRASQKMVELLLDHVKKDQLNDFINAKTTGSGSTALHVAAANNSLNIVQSLLKGGAVYNIRNNKFQTPLALATDEKIRNMFSLIEDVFGHTRNGNRSEVIRKLNNVEATTLAAVMNARNDQEKTLLQLSIAKGDKILVKQLLDILKKQK